MKKRLKLIFILTAAVVFISGIFSFKVYHAVERNRQIRGIASFHSLLEKKIRKFPGVAGVSLKVLRFKGKRKFFVQKEDFDFYYNRDRRFVAASVIKLPVMLACFDKIRKGNLRLDDVFVLKKRMKTGGSGILKAYKTGTKLTLRQLLKLMIFRSDNTAANMMIEITGDKYIQDFMRRKSYNNTVLSRRIMDLYARRQGRENYISCEDVEKMLAELYNGYNRNDRLSIFMMRFLLSQKINDRIPRGLPSGIPVAHKTGLERSVVHDAGIVFLPAADYILCVFTQSKAGYREAKKFIADISRTVYNFLTQIFH